MIVVVLTTHTVLIQGNACFVVCYLTTIWVAKVMYRRRWDEWLRMECWWNDTLGGGVWGGIEVRGQNRIRSPLSLPHARRMSGIKPWTPRQGRGAHLICFFVMLKLQIRCWPNFFFFLHRCYWVLIWYIVGRMREAALWSNKATKVNAELHPGYSIDFLQFDTSVRREGFEIYCWFGW